jgi:UPF0716 protein FxsA
LVKSIFIGLLLAAAVEITVFIAIAREIGTGTTLLLALAASVAGVLILKWVGRAQIEKVRRAVAQRAPLAIDSGDMMLVIGGILLVVPGFVTDLIGVALLLPPVRRSVARTIGRLTRRQRSRRPDGVVELERDEWRQVREDQIEDGRRKD